MSDNVDLSALTGTCAADDVGGVLFQRVKLAQGADGVATDVSSAAPLQVTLANTGANATSVVVDLGSNNDVTVTSGTVSATQSGTWTVQPGNTANTTAWKVDASSVAVPVTDNSGSLTVDGTVAATQSGTWNVGTVTTVTNVVHVDDNSSTLSVDDGAGSLTVDVGTALPAGTNAIGKLAANSGVDIGDVDVTSVIAGTGATNLGKAEDAAHSSGDTGVMALAVRKDTSSTGIGADGDYVPLAVNSTGHAYVAIDSSQLGSLGQTTAASSAPVVLASDRQNSVTFSVAMTTDTGAYASGDLIADTQIMNGFFNKTDGKGVIDSVTIFDAEDNTASAYYVLFHQTSTSMGTENSAPSITDANAAAGILGFVPIASTDWLDIGNSKVASVRNVGLRVSAVSGTDDLYVSIVNGAGTPTFTGGVVNMVIGGFLD